MWFKILFINIVIVFFISCSNKSGTQEQKFPSVFVRKVQLESISDTLTYPARINAKANATILSETSGIIRQSLVTLGQRVRAQQPLMVLTHTDPVYQYAPVQILAPISGIVSSIDATPGTHVVEGQALASVVNPAQIEVQTEVPAQDLSVVTRGLVGEFKMPGIETPVRVEVLGVSPFVKPGTGTASAKLKIISTLKQVLSPGIQGQVSFKANLHQGFLIPDNAIVYKGKNTFVKIVENRKVKQISVELGTKQRGYVEIPKGLFGGAELIERSSRSLAEGESVEIEAPSNPQGNS